jgi:hypothetical protein
LFILVVTEQKKLLVNAHTLEKITLDLLKTTTILPTLNPILNITNKSFHGNNKSEITKQNDTFSFAIKNDQIKLAAIAPSSISSLPNEQELTSKTLFILMSLIAILSSLILFLMFSNR